MLSAIGVLALTSGCESVGYDPADWELFVDAPLPLDAELLRICVAGAPVYEVGAGNGRAAVTGLNPTDTEVRVEILDKAGAYIGVTERVPVADATPIVTTRLLDANLPETDPTPCIDDGEYVANDEDSRLLAVRFAEE